MPQAPRDCPCGSGARYAACCGPPHAGARAAPTPEALMRSRYAAFALGLGAYLADTLAEAHPDTKAPRDALVRTLSRQRETHRFLGLEIWDAPPPAGDTGEVLFYARIFERGKDRSFAELSTFRREGGAWKYERGVLVRGAALPAPRAPMSRDAFLALARAAG